MKVAVIGARGQVGTEVVAAANGAGMDVLALDHEDCDVTDPASIERALAPLREGDAVVNTAAFHKVDECEDRPHEAARVNAAGAFSCAHAARKRGAAIVFVSSDFVFDGEKGASYLESDMQHPINVYGATKAAGEALVAATNPAYYVARLASVFGVAGSSGKGGNFVEAMLRLAKAGEQPSVVDDIVMSPTSARDAAALLIELLQRRAPHGVYHLANAGACSWREFADAIFEEAGLPVRAHAVKSAARPTRARRPANSSLASEKLTPLGLGARPWRAALRDYLRAKGHVTLT